VGDAVDNIPGVAGIGDKTARTLLAEYGSLDAIYASLDALSRGQRAKLEAGREDAYWSKSLILPQEIAPIDRGKLRRGEVEHDAALALCERLGLKRLIERLGLNDRAAVGTASARGEGEGVFPEADFGEILRESELVLASDPEIVMARDGRWSKLGGERTARFHAWRAEGQVILADYRAWCARDHAFRDHHAGIMDVELADYFYHPDSKTHALAAISPEGERSGVRQAEQILNLHDRACAAELASDMRRVMAEIDAPLVSSLLRLQERGLAVDLNALRALDTDLNARIRKIQEEIYQAAGGTINLNSPKQVGTLLFEQLRLPAVKKTKTGYSTDVGVLEELARLPEPLCNVPSKMLEYRECSKMSSGFLHPFMQHAESSRDGKIHSTFLHNVTGTGRLASRDPNAQNLPVFGGWAARFRGAIVPSAPSRVFVAADYSQIELRVLAHLCGDERLLEAFANGRDIHSETAAWVFGLPAEDVTPEQRRFAKTVNFGLLYGMSAHGLAQRLGIPTQQAGKLVDRYFSVLPRVKRYLEESAKEARARGYTRSVFGRIRPLSEVATVEGRGGNPIDRVAVNTPIQSAAADIAKIALFRFDEALRTQFPDAYLVLQVHDSLVCETPRDSADDVEKLLVEVMEGVTAISVPIKAEPKRGNSMAEI